MDSESPFHFRTLDVKTIEEEIATIRSVEKELDEEWKTESLKYEETITVPHCSHPVARRNYFNPEGIVQDVSLFPYHDVYYALIDAYDCLYSSEREHPILKRALRPRLDRIPQSRSIGSRIQQHEIDSIENILEYIRRCFFTSPVFRAQQFPYHDDVLYTSPDSVVNCILLEDETELLPSAQWIPGETPARLYDGQHEFWSQMRLMFLQGKSLDEVNINLPSSFKLSREVKVHTLLRLLRHALSEYQRDYYLALSILTRLSRERALDDVSILRQLLLIVNSECVECGNFCEQEEEDEEENRDHHCGEWSAFINGLHLAIGLGISVITEEHAITLVSFVRSRYLDEFGHLLVESEQLEKQRRTRLKRVIAALRTEDGPSNLHIQFVEILLRSLGTRASLERKRCREAINRGTVSDEILGTFLSSYWNSVRALVDIGDATVEMIPDSEPYFTLASEAVKNIAYGFMERVLPPANRVHDMEYHDEGSTYLMPAHNDLYPNVISPCRYLHHLLQKQEPHLFTGSHKQHGGIDSQTASAILDSERPGEVLKTVRSLFVRDMVDIRLSRMGYGDFVVWCEFELNMDDPIMFWHEYQFPVEEGEDTQASEDSDDDEPWVQDENGNTLSPSQLWSRYDFCLLVTLRAWQAPWSPLMHHTFSRSFRRSIKELFLCTHRLRIPNEVVLRILPFIDRRWWPDTEPQCWSYSCQLDTIAKDMRSRRQKEAVVPSGIAKPLLACAGCQTPVYCSKKCLKDDMKAGHRRLCCLPPFMRSVSEELTLFKDVFKENIPEILLHNTNPESAEVNNVSLADIVENSKNEGNCANVDDDDGSWESWDSNENDESLDTPLNLTETISNYFSKS